jgi:cysteine synthase B
MHQGLTGLWISRKKKLPKWPVKLAKVEGVFAGMSSGGALSAAIKLASELTEGVIVFICCDRGDRYLSSELFG